MTNNIFAQKGKKPALTGFVTLTSTSEESLVTDVRDRLSPAELVERKLVGLMRATPVPVSQLRSATRLLARR
jgi:hypothetical protein